MSKDDPRFDERHKHRDDDFSRHELVLSSRNHSLPAEALRHDTTPAGLHYTLIHWDIPVVDSLEDYSVKVFGRTKKELTLTMDDIRSRPSVTIASVMECAGNNRSRQVYRPSKNMPWGTQGCGCARWTGTLLWPIIEEAGLESNAQELLFTGYDKGVQGGEVQYYQRSLTLEEAKESAMLVYEMNGSPLLPQHGAPLRLLVPGWYGMTNVKWLKSIQAIDFPFNGYQMRAYARRYRKTDTGERVRKICPRALVVPPGVPDFFTRKRFVESGSHTLFGRAWSGFGEITGVEISFDDGKTWEKARLLEHSMGKYAWTGFEFLWEAHPGEYIIRVRASDETGRTQENEDEFNYTGMANPVPQSVAVVVKKALPAGTMLEAAM